MDGLTAVGILHIVAMAVALAACAGLRAWLPLLLAGALARMDVLQLGSQFAFLSSNKALLLLGLATVIEIAADKVPALDHGLDAVSTVLRPAAGALLATAVIGRVSDPLTAWVLGTATGAPAALVPHVAKSGLRLASSAFTLGLANPLVSFAEDAATLALFTLALVVPLVICGFLFVATLVVVRRLARRPTLAT